MTPLPCISRNSARISNAIPLVLLLVGLGNSCLQADEPIPPYRLRLSPSEIRLSRPEGSQQVLALAESPKGKVVGATRDADYRVADASVASVDSHGRVSPRGDGVTTLIVQWGGQIAEAPIEVRGVERPRPVSFRGEVSPILTKAGCNSGGCHGKAEGQNGFRLSIFGFDVEGDHAALVKEGRGRRVRVSAPEQSLLLRKGLAETPHGGGQKLEPGSAWHRLLRRWIAEGAALDEEAEQQITAISVEPSTLTLGFHESRQLRVTAVDAQGNERCVTGEAEFQTNADAVAVVAEDGLLTTKDSPGEAAILVRYQGHVATCRVTLPVSRNHRIAKFERPPEANYIDRFVWDKLETMGLEPSRRSEDGEFLRRVTLDTIGRLPTVAEAREFLADDRPNKRQLWIEQILNRDEYAAYWAMRWADILRVDKSIVSPQGAVGMTRWLKRQFRDNTPYDQWVREIILARGSTWAESPAAFYQVHQDPEELARAVSQVFLGVRIECAQCHHHPFERWGQSDYFAFSSFFTGVQRKKAGPYQKVSAAAGKDLSHPRSGEPTPAAGLGASPAELGDGDRRAALAHWMTARDNPFLAKTIANRLWSHYFDRGLVEPIDDLRETNPATNEPLLAAMANQLHENQFDLKDFTRTLLLSEAYQRSSRSTDNNAPDTQHYSHAAWKSLPAEVLLDAICDVTESAQAFNGWPEGVRAIEVWDNRMPSYFSQVFGRPQRVSVCECERGDAPSIAQALHLMNAPETVAKIRSRAGRAARLARSKLTPAEIIEELYLASLTRRPSAAESQWMLQAFGDSPSTTTGERRREAVEDVLWALLNSKEFVFNH